MKNTVFKGCATALLTPFKDDRSVDFDAYATLVRRQVEGGVDFLVPLGTSAETPTLNREEKKEILKITKKEAPRLPLLVGCGSNSINATLENISSIEYADALLIVVPFYNKPTQEGIYQYYKALAEKTELPIIMYNVPGRTGVKMSAETALRIAFDVKTVIGIKEASGDISQVKTIIERCPENFTVLSGDDDMTFDLINAGAQGVISVASNVLPAQVSQMVHLALEGHKAEARQLNEKLYPLFKGCFVESNPIPAKEALHQLGLCSAKMRLPLTEASEKTKELIYNILKEWR